MDDQSISDDCLLYRRIKASPRVNIVWDANENCWRPSSSAFDNLPNTNSMSVVIDDTLCQLGRSPKSILDGYHGFALASFTAGFVRQLEQQVTREPTDEEPAHGHVIGKKAKSIRRKLARKATWEIPPEIPND
jgi:hypothetical protein